MAGVSPVQELGLHVHVERALTAARLDAGDALHLGWRFEVLKVLRFIDEHVIDAEFIKD